MNKKRHIQNTKLIIINGKSFYLHFIYFKNLLRYIHSFKILCKTILCTLCQIVQTSMNLLKRGELESISKYFSFYNFVVRLILFPSSFLVSVHTISRDFQIINQRPLPMVDWSVDLLLQDEPQPMKASNQ